MKLVLVLLLMLSPTSLLAQSAFEKLVGTWRGEGQYSEAPAHVQLRCRITIEGDGARIELKGRCGSSLGAEDFFMEFVLAPDREVRLVRSASERAAGSKIETLSGPLGRNGMVVRGTAPGEEVVVQLLLNPDGTLEFATRETNGPKEAVSQVTLSRQ